jgi:hypothetical protein
MDKQKIFSRICTAMCALTFVVAVLLFIFTCSVGFGAGFSSIGDHAASALLTSSPSADNFLSDRTFGADNVIFTSFGDTAIDKSKTRVFDVGIESFARPDITASSATVWGPYGFKIRFEEGTAASEYGLSEGYVKEISAPDPLPVGTVRLAHYNSSHVYLIRSGADTLAQISGDVWNDIENNGWTFSIKNKDGSLLQQSGKLDLVIMMKEYVVYTGDGASEIVEEEYKAYTYSISANESPYFKGILQKNGKQSDYKFQLSVMAGDDVIMPRSEKISIPASGTMDIGVRFDDKYKVTYAVVQMYRVDENTGESTFCQSVMLILDDEGLTDQTVTLNFEGQESGIYRIVLRAQAKQKLSRITSLYEFFNTFASKEVHEVYEYYCRIGELQ